MLAEILQDIPQEESEDCRVWELVKTLICSSRPVLKITILVPSAGFVQRHTQNEIRLYASL